jgi:hypothetical protein
MELQWMVYKPNNFSLVIKKGERLVNGVINTLEIIQRLESKNQYLLDIQKPEDLSDSDILLKPSKDDVKFELSQLPDFNPTYFKNHFIPENVLNIKGYDKDKYFEFTKNNDCEVDFQDAEIFSKLHFMVLNFNKLRMVNFLKSNVGIYDNWEGIGYNYRDLLIILNPNLKVDKIKNYKTDNIGSIKVL